MPPADIPYGVRVVVSLDGILNTDIKRDMLKKSIAHVLPGDPNMDAGYSRNITSISVDQVEFCCELSAMIAHQQIGFLFGRTHNPNHPQKTHKQHLQEYKKF